MFEQKRLGDNGTSAARSEEFDDRGDEMNKQHDQVAHLAIVAISTSVTRLGTRWDLCDKSAIRHRQVLEGDLGYNDAYLQVALPDAAKSRSSEIQRVLDDVRAYKVRYPADGK